MEDVVNSVSVGRFPLINAEKMFARVNDVPNYLKILDCGRHRLVFHIVDTDYVLKLARTSSKANAAEVEFYKLLPPELLPYFVPVVGYAVSACGQYDVLVMPKVEPLLRDDSRIPDEIHQYAQSYSDEWNFDQPWFIQFEDYLNDLLAPFDMRVDDLFGPNCTWDGEKLQILDYADCNYRYPQGRM